MDLVDQVAIHEAMEQQTISIAKAGIHASLNARTSILAAANPVHGRYDKRKSLRQNIAMTPPIMSRFDLFFIVIDDNSEVSDYNIARHILSIHRLQDEALDPEFGESRLRSYIRFARSICPQMTSESQKLLVEKYVSLRQSDEMKSCFRMTVRQLESMIRLSEALARVHLDPWIQPRYVMEAYRLLKSSIIRVESENIELAYEAMASLSSDPIKSTDIDLSKNVDENQYNSQIDKKNTQSGGGGSSMLKTGAITYEEYVRISNLLVYYLRSLEVIDESKEQDKGVSGNYLGLKKSELVEWYLTQIENELGSEQEYYEKKLEVEAVIERLVHTDCVLLEIDQQSKSGSVDPFIMVHPNYTNTS